MVFYFIFFCAWLWLFRARPQATVAPKMPRGLGWGKNQKRLPKKPGRGVWFLQHARSRRFWEGEGTGKGWEQRDVGSLTFFYSVHSTAHGKPLVVDSSSYV
jgi:hypothetical protein